ncbi:MAG: glycosyl hydrolase [Flavobacteriales bacterium]
MKLQRITLCAIAIALSACTQNQQEQNTTTTKPLKESVANWEGCMVSAYLFQEDGRVLPENSLELIEEFETLIEHDLGSVMWYPTFADNFPTKECNALKEKNIIPHLTWELFFPDSVAYNTMPLEGTYSLMDQVLNGNHDAYIEQFALDAKEYSDEVLIRFLHEFNGNWYLWGGKKNGAENGGPQKVVAVWKYVVDKFRAVGADNVKWIWNPHGPSIDIVADEWNNIANYWPGDAYVDWIGMDAYNWYPKDPWGGTRPYRDFDNCFRTLYDACTELGDQPIMIAEFGTPEFEYEGQNKALWIQDAFDKIKNDYTRIKLFVWFQINKELDWRVNSSDAALLKFKEGIKDPYFSAMKGVK